MNKGKMMITIGIACLVLSGFLFYTETMEVKQSPIYIQEETESSTEDIIETKPTTEQTEITGPVQTTVKQKWPVYNFNEEESEFYYQLTDFFINTAIGKNEEATFKYLLNEDEYKWSFNELNYNTENTEVSTDNINLKLEEKLRITNVVNAVLYNNSTYDYWTSDDVDYFIYYGIQTNSQDNTICLTDISLSFVVSKSYSRDGIDGDIYLNTNKVKNTVKQMEQAADEIINQCEGLSDYDKILYYVVSICDLTSYDTYTDVDLVPAISHRLTGVFDNNPYTQSVCDGYAKAFKFLCDKTEWQSDLVDCFILTGSDHAWNMVTLEDGKTYMVDVTWADNDETGLINPNYVLVPVRLDGSNLVLLPEGKYEDNSYREVEELSLWALEGKELATEKHRQN